MDSLLAVEREVDKANDAFDLFYSGVDQDIDKTLANLTQMMNQLVSGKQIQRISICCE